MFIYFCKNCSKFDAFEDKTGKNVCPDCGKEFAPLGVTIEEWNEFSNEEMLALIEKVQKPEIKSPDFSAMSQSETEIRQQTNPNKDAFYIVKVSNSHKGNFNAARDWLITGVSYNSENITEGSTVDIYSEARELLATLPV